MQKWLKELTNNNQPLKRVGGLIFEVKMEQEEQKVVKHCETCNEDYEVCEGDYTCEKCGDWLE
jgi:Zn finger protein HypA/HybF involved in hydrogenase expression